MCASDAESRGGTLAQRAREACAALLESVNDQFDEAALPDTMIRRLLTLAVGAYAARLEAGEPCEPFAPESRLTASEVCPVVARMLRAVDVDLFELAMWQHLVDG